MLPKVSNVLFLNELRPKTLAVKEKFVSFNKFLANNLMEKLSSKTFESSKSVRAHYVNEKHGNST
jgi:hypothetical protein